MAECTELERELLDKIGQRDSGGSTLPLHELRMQVLIARVPRELFDAAVEARRRLFDATKHSEKIWDRLHEMGIGGSSNAFDAFYEKISAEAEKPQ